MTSATGGQLWYATLTEPCVGAPVAATTKTVAIAARNAAAQIRNPNA